MGIDRDMIVTFARYIFDGLLVAIVWLEAPMTILSTDALWTDAFGRYADIVKTSIQVIITILVAVTAFYRMLLMIKKYRESKKNKKK